MKKTVAVIGGDKRFALLAAKMLADGYEVYTFGLNRFCAVNAVPLEKALQAQRIVLPMPLSREEGYLNCFEERILLRELWQNCSTPCSVYAGAVREDDRRMAVEYGIVPVDYLACEELAIYNAVPTAEGALEAAIGATEITLHGAPCLVLGFGRIGKVLAQRLHALGAQVSVSARRKTDLAWMEAFGYRPLPIGCLDGRLGEFRIIFNTVPQLILKEQLLGELRPDCVLIELASCTGFDVEAAQKLGLRCICAQALPGKTAPESAAKAICATLYQLWGEEK